MKWHAHVLSTPTTDSSTSLLIYFDDKRYLIGAGDGLTRVVSSYGSPLKHTAKILVPSLHPDSAGGLFAMLFRMQGVRVKGDSLARAIEVYGPKNLFQFLASGRKFAAREGLYVLPTEVTKHDSPLIKMFEDKNLFAYAIATSPSSSPESRYSSSESETDSSSSSSINPRDHKKQRFSSPKSDAIDSSANDGPSDRAISIVKSMYVKNLKEVVGEKAHFVRQRLSSVRTDRTVLSFLFIRPKVRGRFLPEVARELGLTDPKLYKHLTAGKSITAPSGRVVHPHEVLEPSMPQQAMIYVKCPTTDYVDEIVASTSFQEKLAAENVNSSDLIVYHDIGNGVLDDKRYTAWMSSFGEGVQHKILSKEFTPNKISLIGATRLQLRLQKIDDKIFPIPHYSLNAKRNLSEIENLPPDTTVPEIQDRHSITDSAQFTTLRVRRGFDFLVPSEEAERETQQSDEVLAQGMYDEYIKQVNEIKEDYELQKSLLPVPSDKGPGDDLVVSFLGTASAVPSVFRNVSGTMITMPNGKNFILDCGEGTWGQICRLFGLEKAKDMLANTEFIFISHIHLDHHGGLCRLLVERMRLKINQQLYIICPNTAMTYVKEQNEIFGPFLKGVQFIDFRTITDEYRLSRRENILERQCCELAGLERISTVPVMHSIQSMGIIIKHRDWKVVFSGDTKPCKALVEAGKNATLLIHEATHGDAETEMACKKGHSTMSQAVQIATQMNAKYCMLTHFSARYPIIPGSIIKDREKGDPVFGLSFDYMTIKASDIWKMHRFIRPLRMLFEISDDKTESFEG